MSTQIFLHLEIAGNTIKGEATAAGYEGQIELESFRFGLSAEHKVRSDGRGLVSSKKYDNLSFSKLYDKSSINFARYLNQRTPFDHAQLTVDHHLKAGAKKQANPTLVIDISEGFIEEVRISISESDHGATVKEDIKLFFKKLEFAYHPTGDRATRGAAVLYIAP